MNQADSLQQREAPRVTALVLTRDCADSLRSCLEALEGSTDRAALEILVVDNGSRDSTSDVLAAFPSVITLRLPKNFGATKALNIGMRTAKGDYVLFLPPRFQVAADTIATMAAQLAATDVGAVCPYVRRWYRLPAPDAMQAALLSQELPQAETSPDDAAVVAVDYPAGAPLMLRRSFLVGMNYLDERFGEYWWDLELCWQIRRAGKRILVLPELKLKTSEYSNGQETGVWSADWAIGAARYVGKHYGARAGVALRLRAALTSLGRVVTFRNPGFHFQRLSAIVSGQKIDGTQE